MPLKPGDKAPDFTLLDQQGEAFTLSESLDSAKACHLIYFYPKADTPGCTKQSCGLRDIIDEIGDTVVLGISPDTPDRQARFDQKYGLGFPLLADEDHAVAEAYGAWGTKSMYGKKYQGIIRSAFLVDEAGNLLEVWHKISPADTPKNLLSALVSRKAS
ncbi:MAG: thioredoxin-dependent thiol peroxidase [Acidimicrobiales bacterium]